jgi:hypothetical protein
MVDVADPTGRSGNRDTVSLARCPIVRQAVKSRRSLVFSWFDLRPLAAQSSLID